ncbi:tyrosine-type recombinase/integrase [Clostridium sp.]|uniref:tyrosine-type recombinase/integrase n=1 Tax=Clostridium sp. TaxID=1506 RepID=UPI002632A75A|nr:tyrosine-type recombinase/integrase [uncultured Clostridium sp.]
MKKTDFPYYLASFLGKYLPGQKNSSPNTIESYATTFKLLLAYCEKEKKVKPERLTLSFLTHDLIIEFLDWIEKERKCTISTRNQRMVALYSFFRYVQKEAPENLYEIQKILNIPNKKGPKTIVPFLTGAEMKILLEQPNTATNVGRRDFILLVILYDTAARVQELIVLKNKDIRISKPAVITLTGKGNKTRQVPIMDKTKKLIENYLINQKVNNAISKGENYLFVNQRNQKLSLWGVSYIINKYVVLAKQNPKFTVPFPVTLHVFRHSKSMHLLQSGINLIYIRDFLGHCDCSTTEIYARADTEMKRKAIEEAYSDILPSTDLPIWGDDTDLMRFLNSICKK